MNVTGEDGNERNEMQTYYTRLVVVLISFVQSV